MILMFKATKTVRDGIRGWIDVHEVNKRVSRIRLEVIELLMCVCKLIKYIKNRIRGIRGANVCACMCACVRASMCACVCECVCVLK